MTCGAKRAPAAVPSRVSRALLRIEKAIDAVLAEPHVSLDGSRVPMADVAALTAREDALIARLETVAS